MPSTLNTSHELMVATGDAPAIIRVSNITSRVQGPSDAWGRSGRTQPISVSVQVCMKSPFNPTSSADSLNHDTIHYGLLSKAILSSLAKLDDTRDELDKVRLSTVLSSIWSCLVGLDIDGEREVRDEPPFLNVLFIRSLEVTVRLPKATLHGDGVSLTRTGIFDSERLTMTGSTLKLHDLRIPILLGVNDHERGAEQGVIANLTVERFDEADDSYCGLERVFLEVSPARTKFVRILRVPFSNRIALHDIKSMTSSSFETIEALVGSLAYDLTRHLVDLYAVPGDGGGWHLGIAIEKPVAVVFADAPCVEMKINTNDVKLAEATLPKG